MTNKNNKTYHQNFKRMSGNVHSFDCWPGSMVVWPLLLFDELATQTDDLAVEGGA